MKGIGQDDLRGSKVFYVTSQQMVREVFSKEGHVSRDPDNKKEPDAKTQGGVFPT